MSRPFPIILSSPSGGGKTTIAKELLARRGDIGYSVSCTTRLPRPGETDGKDYYFLSRGEFEQARDLFLELALAPELVEFLTLPAYTQLE